MSNCAGKNLSDCASDKSCIIVNGKTKKYCKKGPVAKTAKKKASPKKASPKKASPPKMSPVVKQEIKELLGPIVKELVYASRTSCENTLFDENSDSLKSVNMQVNVVHIQSGLKIIHDFIKPELAEKIRDIMRKGTQNVFKDIKLSKPEMQKIKAEIQLITNSDIEVSDEAVRYYHALYQ